MEWKEVRLGDVCTELSDGLHKAPKFVKGGEYIFVNAKNLDKGYIRDVDEEKKTTYEEYLKYASPINQNTILYSIDGTIGNIARYRGEKCVLGKGACYINPNINLLDATYAYYQLQSKHFNGYVDLMSTGSTIRHISLKTMRDYTFTLPPLNIQRRISSILSSLDSKIETNNKINAKLEEMAQALFKSWFVDFEPFKDGKIAEVALNITDGVHNTVQNDDNSNFLLLSCKNIVGGKLSISDKERTISEDTFLKLRKRTKLEKGDILISTVGTVGEIVLLDIEPNNIEFQRSVGIIKPNPQKVSSYYLYLALLSRQKELKHVAHGAVQQCIFISDIKDFDIPIAPIEKIREFDNVVKPLFERITTLTNESSRLSLLRDTLLPKLMSGEINLDSLPQ